LALAHRRGSARALRRAPADMHAARQPGHTWQPQSHACPSQPPLVRPIQTSCSYRRRGNTHIRS
jgi:hypothetical protein